MFGFMLFLHLTGLVVWIGSLLAIVVMLSMLKNQLGSQGTTALAQRIIRAFSLLAHPSAVVVLISGVVMIVKMGIGPDRPLWLDVMEKGGGTIILLALVLTGILGRRVKLRLAGGQGREVKVTGYVTALASFMLLAAAVVLVASMKI